MAITDSKKEAFINAFILTGCKEGTKAAIKAGYSQKTAAQQASRLLKDVKVQQAIESQKKLNSGTKSRGVALALVSLT